MGAEPSKFMGSIVAPTAKEHEHKSYKSGFDPNLLVGPLYDSGPSRQNAIREQMGDITSILHEVCQLEMIIVISQSNYYMYVFKLVHI